jgi:hypothetical protein
MDHDEPRMINIRHRIRPTDEGTPIRVNHSWASNPRIALSHANVATPTASSWVSGWPPNYAIPLPLVYDYAGVQDSHSGSTSRLGGMDATRGRAGFTARSNTDAARLPGGGKARLTGDKSQPPCLWHRRYEPCRSLRNDVARSCYYDHASSVVMALVIIRRAAGPTTAIDESSANVRAYTVTSRGCVIVSCAEGVSTKTRSSS